jgi:hypothetical protein
MDGSLNGVLLPKDHPLAQQSYLSLVQLQPLTRLHNPRTLSGEVFRALRKALLVRGLEPSRLRAVPSDITTLGMHLTAGDAYCLANDRTAKPFVAAHSGVVFRRFIEPAIPMWVTLMWRAGDSAELLQDLVRIARDMTQKREAVA